MDSAAYHHAAFCDGLQRLRNERAHRGEKQRRIQFVRRRLVAAAGPRRAETQRELLGSMIAGACQRIHGALLMARNLRDDMRRGAETVNADPLRVARHAERPIADEPGA